MTIQLWQSGISFLLRRGCYCKLLSDVRIKLNAAELRLCYVDWGIIY